MIVALTETNGHACSPERPRRFGDFYYGDTVESVDPGLRADPFADLVIDTFLRSFITSQGRQYAQLAALAAAVRIIDQSQIGIDWQVIDGYRIPHDIPNWILPGVHVQTPAAVPGQVDGVYLFWWLAQRDVFHLILEGQPLPSHRELRQRYRDCGVPLYLTSSTIQEELLAIYYAFDELRGLAGASLEALIWACIPLQLAAEGHWQTTRRPRRSERDGWRAGLRPDRHELLLRTMILGARALPVEDRGPLDVWALLIADELNELVVAPRPDPETQEVRDLYNDLLGSVNDNRRRNGMPLLTSLHR